MQMSRPLAWSANHTKELPSARHRGDQVIGLFNIISKHYVLAVSNPLIFTLRACATLEFRIQQEFRVMFYQFGEEEQMTKEARKRTVTKLQRFWYST